MKTLISTQTTISIGLMGTILFAAFSFGVMYNEFQTVKRKTDNIENSVSIISEKVQSIEFRMRENQSIQKKLYGMGN